MEALEEKLGYRFTNRAFLENALTHSSYANENKAKGLQSNERLEFLGDSVLGMVVADYLFRTHPDLPEGDLTRTRAALVCEGSLVEVAQCLELGAYLKLGKGEEAGGGRERPSIIADAVEAVLAAVYLDGGIGSARKLIQKFILDRPPGAGAAGERPGAGLPAHRRRGPRSRQDLLGGGGSQRHPHRPGPRPQQKRGGAERGQGCDREVKGWGITGRSASLVSGSEPPRQRRQAFCGAKS